MELQITHTRHPKSDVDGQTEGRSGPTTRPAFAKAMQVKIFSVKGSIFLLMIFLVQIVPLFSMKW